MLLVAVDLVAGLDRGDQLFEEEILVRMAGHVEVAVPVVVDVGIAGVGHDDDHRHDLAAGDEFVHHVLHMARGRPILIGAVQAVEEVDDRVLDVRGGVEAGGQVHVYVDRTAEEGTVHPVGQDDTLAERLAEGGGKEKQACEEAHHQSFHIGKEFPKFSDSPGFFIVFGKMFSIRTGKMPIFTRYGNRHRQIRP